MKALHAFIIIALTLLAVVSACDRSPTGVSVAPASSSPLLSDSSSASVPAGLAPRAAKVSNYAIAW